MSAFQGEYDLRWARRNVRAFIAAGWRVADGEGHYGSEEELAERTAREIARCLPLARSGGRTHDTLALFLRKLHADGGVPRIVWEDADD